MDYHAEFMRRNAEEAARQGADAEFARVSADWLVRATRHRYTYHFRWLGRPVIQYPQDLLAVQELLWSVRPELVVETGVAWGGSLVFHASILELLGGPGRVLGIDVEVRPHNRAAILQHPLAHRIDLIEGSSTAPEVVAEVRRRAAGKRPVLVILDSNHTHAHVLEELRAYAPLVTRGSYLVVFDTSVEDAPKDLFPDRPWGPGDNPKTAVRAFLNENERFVVDRAIDDTLLITNAPGGYLKCVKDA